MSTAVDVARDVACPACGGAFVSAAPAREMFDGESFGLARCEGCGLLRAADGLEPRELGSFYRYHGNADAGQRFAGVLEPLMRGLRRARARQVARAVPRSGRVLDVGCGRGVLLDELARLGWDVHGTELDADVAASARARHGNRIQIGPLRELRFRAAPFDLITFWHVLEHLDDAPAALAAAASLLAEDGRILIGIPNLDSWQARFAGRHWLHLDVPRHRWHFSVETLGRVAERAGLSIIGVEHFSLEYGPYGWLQSALSRAGLGHVLFTDILRRRPGMGRDPRVWAHAALGGPIAAAGLASLFLELVASAAGAGGAVVLTLAPSIAASSAPRRRRL